MDIFELPLFRGISRSEQEEIRNCGCLRRKSFEKNEIIFHMGDQVQELGIVLSGNITIEGTDLWGNRSILTDVSPGQIFAETYALCHEPLMVRAVAAEASDILFFHLNALKASFVPEISCNAENSRKSQVTWQGTVTRNLLYLSAKKNLILSDRIFCTTPKTIRNRLLIYLSGQSAKAQSTRFRIPFDRQGLADYLNVDRSALSKELGRMRHEGILEFHKNQFTLCRTSETEIC